MKIIPLTLSLYLSVIPTTGMAATKEISLKFQTVIANDEFVISTTKPLPDAGVATSLTHNDIRHTFTPYTNEFKIKSNKSVKALLKIAPNLIKDAKTSIPVHVSIGPTKITLAPQEVHAADPGEKLYNFTVEPVNAVYAAGTYTGEVQLVFDVT